MKKMILVGLASVTGFTATCTAGLFLWVAISTSGAATEADKFLGVLSEGEIGLAYKATSSEFQAEQDEGAFGKIFKILNLTEHQLESWRDRSVAGRGIVVLQGSFKEKGLTDHKFTIEMTKEEGEWKVRSVFDRPRIGIGPGAWFQYVPSYRELERLTKKSLMEFDRGVQAGDFSDFYDSMSVGFRLEIPRGTLLRVYQHFIDDQIEFSGLIDSELVLGEPTEFERDKNGDILVVTGYYPTETRFVPFSLRYRYEHPNWKLYRVFVEKPRTTPPASMLGEVPLDAPKRAEALNHS